MNEHFVSLLHQIGLGLSDTQMSQFQDYYRLLMKWNNQMNLTSITDEEEVYVKHFYDSLCLIKAVDIDRQTLLDVGSGAGFPSIPLKIMFPQLKVTIIDALQKRITFLTELTQELGVDVELIHGRAEEHDRKNHYDIVTARAVAALPLLVELCLPFAKPGGHFLAMKGPQYKEELEQIKKALTILSGHIEQTIEYTVDDYNRTIILIHKHHPTGSKYPRKFNKIKSKPL